MADWDADAISEAYEREHPKPPPAMCHHGYYLPGCPWCNALVAPATSEAEKDRRLKAFMPLIHSIVSDRRSTGGTIVEIERILEIVENPRRKVTENAE